MNITSNLKRIIIFFVFILLYNSINCQINVLIYNDIDNKYGNIIIDQFKETLKKETGLNLLSSGRVSNNIDSCSKYGYNGFLFLECLETKRKNICFTSRKINYDCEEDPLDGLSYNGNAIISSFYVKNLTFLLKIALHELGHLYGLSHCNDKFCVMDKGGYKNQYYRYSIEKGFCKKCKKILNEKISNNR